MKRLVPRLDGLARTVAKAELIGLSCEVAASSDAGLVGRAGEVVDETLHTLTLRLHDGRRQQLPKAGNVFRFTLPKGDVVDIDGYAIQFRPQDRTKKVR